MPLIKVSVTIQDSSIILIKQLAAPFWENNGVIAGIIPFE